MPAGLSTPRLPARSLAHRRRCACRTGADRESDGRDVTGHYRVSRLVGAQRRLGSGLSGSVTTDGSPTCGSKFVYDGLRGRRKAGAGVAAELLRAPRVSRYFPTANPAVARLDGRPEGAG
ncbi:DUF523 domain-containing protein [Klebsiella pneumoniae]|nr:DUF523 domain-containing protein [Klebsiella pneumoniae]